MNSNNWVKETADFIIHPTNLETKPERFTTFITPNKEFFVCSQGKTVRINTNEYRLEVKGNGVKRPLSLSYHELLQLPRQTIFCYLECAGSQRLLFEKLLGHTIPDGFTPWMLGAVGMAEWNGVSLRTILEMAGLQPDAQSVNLKGLDVEANDEKGVNRPLPLAKALRDDTILAFAMNGERLPPDHGFPVRAIVPGWIGSNSIKWLGEITVSTEPVWVERNSTMYVLKGEEWPPAQFSPAQGGPITLQNVKSSLALGWEAVLKAGEQTIYGYARSPHAPIDSLVWSDDDGESWQPAELLPPILPNAWVRFRFSWEAKTGEQQLMTKAADLAGNTQPLTIPVNEEGYLFNMVYPHPVTVIP